MKKIDTNYSELQSDNIISNHFVQLKNFFPEAFSEGKIDFEVLKQLLGGDIDDSNERFGLNWHGKKRARQIALTPSSGTLRPCPEESVDWDTTQNLMIEGDNLEVLKLLQKSYAGKVKMIYIDPPYNTGKDFVYPDNFQDSITNYKAITGQVDNEGFDLSTNSEASGRYHTDWLNMMYPRLKLARNLLRDDGCIIISIGDEEVSNLIQICNEIFGENNHSANFIITRSEGGGLANQVIKGHDYLLVYAKNKINFVPLRRTKEIRGKIESIKGEDYWVEEDFLRKEFGKYGTCPYDEIEKYHGKNKKEEIDNGIANGLYKIINKKGVDIVGKYRKVSDDSSKFYTIQKHLNKDATADLLSLGMENVFSYPKPLSIIKDIALGASFFSKNENDIILDFFAGSGTTAQAVVEKNLEDGGNRKYIVVQLPEPLSPKNKDQKVSSEFCDMLNKPRNIAELTKERLRRASKKTKIENYEWQGDTGFRVFKLDASNILPWQADSENLELMLDKHVSTIIDGRNETDLETELMLKRGIMLSETLQTREVVGLQLRCAGNGILFSCLSPHITVSAVEPIANAIIGWHHELHANKDSACYFLDSAFESNVTKSNLSALLKQHGISNVFCL